MKTSKREFYEIENHKGAFEYVLECIRRDKKISVAMIKEVHRASTDCLNVYGTIRNTKTEKIANGRPAYL